MPIAHERGVTDSHREQCAWADLWVALWCVYYTYLWKHCRFRWQWWCGRSFRAAWGNVGSSGYSRTWHIEFPIVLLNHWMHICVTMHITTVQYECMCLRGSQLHMHAVRSSRQYNIRCPNCCGDFQYKFLLTYINDTTCGWCVNTRCSEQETWRKCGHHWWKCGRSRWFCLYRHPLYFPVCADPWSQND